MTDSVPLATNKYEEVKIVNYAVKIYIACGHKIPVVAQCNFGMKLVCRSKLALFVTWGGGICQLIL